MHGVVKISFFHVIQRFNTLYYHDYGENYKKKIDTECNTHRRSILIEKELNRARIEVSATTYFLAIFL